VDQVDLEDFQALEDLLDHVLDLLMVLLMDTLMVDGVIAAYILVLKEVE
jgi:hypothetical protein